MAPKQTDLHFSLRMFKAAQVLSHAVAAGMSLMAQWKIIPQEASHTAEIVEDMDQLCNAFNSRVFSSSATM